LLSQACREEEAMLRHEEARLRHEEARLRREETRRQVEQKHHLRLREEAELRGGGSPPDPHSAWKEAQWSLWLESPQTLARVLSFFSISAHIEGFLL
jgi:hypothetical protein